jgi:hypothetical protein
MFVLEKRLLLFMTFNKFDNAIGRKRCAQPSCSGQSQRRGESLTHTPESANWPLYDGLGAGDTVLAGWRTLLHSFVLQLLNVSNTIAQEHGFQDTSSLFLSPLPKSPAH